jgi:hypothetical protein
MWMAGYQLEITRALEELRTPSTDPLTILKNYGIHHGATGGPQFLSPTLTNIVTLFPKPSTDIKEYIKKHSELAVPLTVHHKYLSKA